MRPDQIRQYARWQRCVDWLSRLVDVLASGDAVYTDRAGRARYRRTGRGV